MYQKQIKLIYRSNLIWVYNACSFCLSVRIAQKTELYFIIIIIIIIIRIIDIIFL